MNKFKLKGFTLMELIVVMAIFSGIMVGVMALVNPVKQIYHRTAEQEDAGADLDNVRRYIEDNLKYANKVNVYCGYDNVNDLLGANAALLPYSYDASGMYSNTPKNVTPIEFFKDYYFANKADKIPKKLYIMEIQSPKYDQFNYNMTKNSDDVYDDGGGIYGNVNIYEYDLKNDSNTLISSANSGYYDDYSYIFHLGNYDSASNKYNGFTYTNSVISVDILENDTGGNHKELLNNGNDAYVSFAFLNLINELESTVSEDFNFNKKYTPPVIDDAFKNRYGLIVSENYKFNDDGFLVDDYNNQQWYNGHRIMVYDDGVNMGRFNDQGVLVDEYGNEIKDASGNKIIIFDSGTYRGKFQNGILVDENGQPILDDNGNQITSTDSIYRENSSLKRTAFNFKNFCPNTAVDEDGDDLCDIHGDDDLTCGFNSGNIYFVYTTPEIFISK